MNGSAARMEALRKRLQEEGAAAALIASEPNRFYLSGFAGSEGLLVLTAQSAHLIVDSRYTEQARAEAPGWGVVQVNRNLGPLLAQILAPARGGGKPARLLFEANRVTVQSWRRWREVLDKEDPGWEWIPIADLVERLRLIKDAGELERIRQAMRLADESFASLLPLIRPGVSERDLALELEWRMRKGGASGTAFEFIVASGPRSALPHGKAGDRVLAAGDLVTFDFGCVLNGYASDMTRTVVLGRAAPRQREVYEAVREAQELGLAAVAPGRACAEVDAAARRRIEDAGFGEAFGHGLGHGVGLEVHEAPRLGPGSEENLQEGMVVTVEPGIYLPGWGGVRIEDTVIVTAGGNENLARFSKELLELA